ncbi:hypothetical protein, partial [Pedobacter fastidiosus]|uniref:hypothetical protein n=1 Tax=Pedobacter fastidiosus TaxID=2765361 RepID=UPI001C9AF840
RGNSPPYFQGGAGGGLFVSCNYTSQTLTPAEMTTVLKKDLKLTSKSKVSPFRSSRNDGSFRKDLNLLFQKFLRSASLQSK